MSWEYLRDNLSGVLSWKLMVTGCYDSCVDFVIAIHETDHNIDLYKFHLFSKSAWSVLLGLQRFVTEDKKYTIDICIDYNLGTHQFQITLLQIISGELPKISGVDIYEFNNRRVIPPNCSRHVSIEP